jgi:ferredoxin
MELSVNTINWLGKPKKACPAEAIKFNRFNMTFNSRQKLQVGQLVFINMSAGPHSLKEVSARVERCERCGPKYQSSVKFVLERPDKRPYREAIAVLKSIEQALPATIKAPLHMQKT